MYRHNCQLDKGLKGPKLSWDNTSKMSKCYTGIIHFAQQITAIFIAPLIKRNRKSLYGQPHYKRPRGPLTPDFMILLRTVQPFSLPTRIESKYSGKGGGRGQCNTCSSYLYNPNLTSGPSGPLSYWQLYFVRFAACSTGRIQSLGCS